MDILIDNYIMSLYQDLEDEVIADIVRRVKKTGRYTETAELMAKSMHEQGYSPAKIQAEVMKTLRADKAYQMAVAENTKAYKQEIQDIIDETVKAAKEANDILVAEAGNMAWNNDLSMWEQHGEDLTKPNNMSQLIGAARAQTMGALKNLTKTMGFKNTNLGTTGVLSAYQRELDLALLKVSTGTFSYDQAVNDCVHRLAQSGLRSIDYANGRTYQLDTAVRMSVRTGMSQLAGKVMEANLESSGQDLVITSQHMGSRPEHVPWQNKVFSYSGKSKKYPDFFKETGYGTVEGLKGANCTHDFYPFWEGASVIPEDIVEPEPVQIDGKEYDYYQATQKQRQMERNIRATKREIEAQSRLGGPTTELRSKLNAQTNEYTRFSRKAGLKVRDNRLRVEKGTSNLEKKKRTIKSVKPTKPTYVFTPAKSIGEAKKYAQDKLGFWIADYDKMNLDFANTLNKEITKMYDLFGNLKEKGVLEGVMIWKKPANWYAAYSSGSKVVGVKNVSGKNTLSKMLKEAKKEKEVGFWSTGDAEHAIRHEVGHAIEHMVRKRNLGAINRIDILRKTVASKCGIVNWDVFAPQEIKTEAGKYISYYALRNEGEFIAEAVAEYMSGSPRKISKQVVEILINDDVDWDSIIKEWK